ncbi:MAG: T9SS type A sorting domain-containing protein, partial [Rubricoccaceae bacterium]|nr:T9SS type A sorting domain-containing protein [Rubricoccaceae bacterium]
AAPAGEYALDLRLGVAFPDVCESVPFTLTVQPAAASRAAAAVRSGRETARAGGEAARSDAALAFEVVQAFDPDAAEAPGAARAASATADPASAPVAVAPNPFSRGAVLSFAVAEATDVRLAVYDVLGREVAVLLDGPAEAGAHRVVLDGRGLAAGTYLWRLVAGERVETGRVTLVR